MTRLLLPATALLILGWINPACGEERSRTLTNREGVQIQAVVLSVANGQVKIRKKDGNVTTFPIDRLCDEDQRMLRALEGKGELAPSGSTATSQPATTTLHRRVYPRTLEEIKAECVNIRAAAQALSGFTDEEKSALAELNISRLLCGVPATVQLSRKLCEGAATASESCAKLGQLSHDASPEAKACNLHQGNGTTFPEAVFGFIEDPGDNNRALRGHRFWCLHPELAMTGFGRDATSQYLGMWVIKGSGPAGGGTQRKKRRNDLSTWPGQGFFPASRMNGDAWSIYPNEPVSNDKLEIRVFELPKRLDRPLAASATPEGGKPINIGFIQASAPPGPGVGGNIVFEPEVEIKAGKIYWVSMKAGAFRLCYCVEFVADDF